VPGHPVVDFFELSFPEIAQRSYYEPDKFLIDPSTMTPQQQTVLAGNRASLSVYAGDTSMMEPSLAKRLSAVTLPTCVIWGDHDRIADPGYDRAYANAIPNAEFVLLAETGYMPQLESPNRLVPKVWDFADAGPPLPAVAVTHGQLRSGVIGHECRQFGAAPSPDLGEDRLDVVAQGVL
jgi:pimeloyl-ACP methyl ester carboxylesterase